MAKVAKKLFHIHIQKHLSDSVLQWTAGGEVALRGDAHHEEGLEGHQDVLERVPHVREQEDEGLVPQVKLKVLGILYC